MPWIDTHCHVHDFDDADEVLDRAADHCVEIVVAVGTDLETSRRAVALADRRPEVWASVGLHPHDASRLDGEWGEIAALADHPRVVGIGESGFDLHYRHSPERDQERAFRSHITLAQSCDRALVIHTRDAWEETFRVLEDMGMPERTVFHCFTGGPEEAERAVGLGAFVSFSGIVTFPSAPEVRAAAAIVPAERLVVETDAPYLAPTPHRGRRNEPMYVPAVAAGVVEATGRVVDSVEAETEAAARALFRFGAE